MSGKTTAVPADSVASDSPSPASEDCDQYLTATLNRIRAKALFARQWCEEQSLDIAEPLTPIVNILSAHNLVVSDALGEAGFEVSANGEIHFNREVLRNVVATTRAIFADRGSMPEEAVEALCEQAIAMYVFHEITHIAQKFVEHGLAQTLKRAFGPDELSKVDLVADVRAAHCNTIVFAAIQNQFSERAYLEILRDNYLLSYELLTKAFSIADADHKKKRALGLLTSAVLVQLALNSDGEKHQELRSLALRPAFTSVDTEQNCIVALTCGSNGWEILFHAQVSTNRITIPEMWDRIGTGEPSDILGLLLVAYEKYASEP